MSLFDNTQFAFESKSDKDLKKAYYFDYNKETILKNNTHFKKCVI